METPNPVIHYLTPYALDGQLAKAYNQEISYFPSDHWICIMDGDTMFLISNWGHLIHEAIRQYPKTGLFTCYTNRVNQLRQHPCLYPGMAEERDMLKHIETAVKLQATHGSLCSKINKTVPGMFMLFKKSTWERVGGFKGHEILKVDHTFSGEIFNHGLTTRRINGLYIFHKYRLEYDDPKKTDHLIPDHLKLV